MEMLVATDYPAGTLACTTDNKMSAMADGDSWIASTGVKVPMLRAGLGGWKIILILDEPIKVGDTVDAADAKKLPNGSVVACEDGGYARLIFDGIGYGVNHRGIFDIDLSGAYKVLHIPES